MAFSVLVFEIPTNTEHALVKSSACQNMHLLYFQCFFMVLVSMKAKKPIEPNVTLSHILKIMSYKKLTLWISVTGVQHAARGLQDCAGQGGCLRTQGQTQGKIQGNPSIYPTTQGHNAYYYVKNRLKHHSFFHKLCFCLDAKTVTILIHFYTKFGSFFLSVTMVH